MISGGDGGINGCQSRESTLSVNAGAYCLGRVVEYEGYGGVFGLYSTQVILFRIS